MKTFEVKVALAISSNDLKTGEHYVVSLNKDSLELPYISLDENLTIPQILIKLIELHIDLDSSWVVPVLMSTLAENDSITILYKCIIPLDTELKNTYWLPIWKCVNNILTREIVRS